MSIRTLITAVFLTFFAGEVLRSDSYQVGQKWIFDSMPYTQHIVPAVYAWYEYEFLAAAIEQQDGSCLGFFFSGPAPDIDVTALTARETGQGHCDLTFFAEIVSETLFLAKVRECYIQYKDYRMYEHRFYEVDIYRINPNKACIGQ